MLICCLSVAEGSPLMARGTGSPRQAYTPGETRHPSWQNRSASDNQMHRLQSARNNTQVLLFLHGGSLQLIVLWAQGDDAAARLRLEPSAGGCESHSVKVAVTE